jgi:hypothetical protein
VQQPGFDANSDQKKAVTDDTLPNEVPTNTIDGFRNMMASKHRGDP